MKTRVSNCTKIALKGRELSKLSPSKLHLWFGPTSAQASRAKPAHNGNMLVLEEPGFGKSPELHGLSQQTVQKTKQSPDHFWNNHRRRVANSNSRLKLSSKLYEVATVKKKSWYINLYLADKIKGGLFRMYPVRTVTKSQMAFTGNYSSSCHFFLLQSNT